jgi:F0F1-type ATP synthase assembly protein I
MKFVELVEDQKTRKLVRRLCYLALFIVVVADFLVYRHHPKFFWDTIPGFSAFFGFISCVLIIVISKAVGHALLMKKEDYYD